MKDAIYHNPRCSKSRQTLALLHGHGVCLPVIEYLKTPPAVEELLAICRAMGRRPVEIVRSREALFAELGLALDDPRDDRGWCEVLCAHPKLIERPIVVYRGRAALGRPPEAVLSLLG